MKKYSFILWAALAMVSVFTACTNEDSLVIEQTEAKTVTIRATIDGDLGSRVTLEDDAENRVVKVDWAEGDAFKITVNNKDYTFVYNPSTGAFEYDNSQDATFPETFTSAGTVTAIYPATAPEEYDNQSGALEGAAAFLTMTATLDVTAGQSTENLALNFTHNNSIVKMTLSNDDFKSKNVTWVTLKSGDAVVATATGTFEGNADNGSIVAYFAVEPQAVTNISIVAVCEYENYTAILTDNTLAKGTLYNVTKEMTATTPMGAVTAANAVKGDLAMKDGTFISQGDIGSLTDEQKANVAGIVFWTTADSNTSGTTPAKLTDDEIMKKDFPNCTHGLIVSLKDVSQGTKWQETCARIAEWQESESFTDEDKDKYESIASPTSATDPINYILGYQNTKILKAYNESLSDNESANTVLPVSLLDEFSDDNPAPANTTGWFIPSVKELTLLRGTDSDNVWSGKFGTSTKTFINGILNSWSGDANVLANEYYWSSSEYGTEKYYAYRVSFQTVDVNANDKNYYTLPVRAVCAY